MQVNKRFILLRFFEDASYVESLRNGNLRMMSSKYYKCIEKNLGNNMRYYNNRYDIMENALGVYNPSNGECQDINIEGYKYDRIWINPECTVGPVIISNDKLDEYTKIYCFYSLFEDAIIDNSLASVVEDLEGNLGQYYCLIHNVDEFIRRVDNAFINSKHKEELANYRRNFVNYIDESKHNGNYGPFLKPLGLGWQKEFRFVMLSKDEEVKWFNIGSIKDITIWGKIEDLKLGIIDGDLLKIPNMIR